MRIEEIGQKVETFVKSDKGKIAIIGGFGGLFLISYMLQKNKLNNSDYEEGMPLSKIYTSYPNVEANSETVIDAIENQIRNEHQNTQDYVNDALTKLQENQTLNTVPNNTLDNDKTYEDVESVDTSNIAAERPYYINQDIFGQDVLYKYYNGEQILSFGTHMDGHTTIYTDSGTTYNIPMGQHIEITESKINKNSSITSTSEKANISNSNLTPTQLESTKNQLLKSRDFTPFTPLDMEQAFKNRIGNDNTLSSGSIAKPMKSIGIAKPMKSIGIAKPMKSIGIARELKKG